MKQTKLSGIIALVMALVLSLGGLAGCFDLGGSGSNRVAATVNGKQILEQDITDAIESMRSQGYSEPASWAQALKDSSLTPASLREEVIRSQARDMVLKQEAEAQGYTIDEAAIDQQIADTRQQVGVADDAEWVSTLQRYGYKNEQAFRDTLVTSNLTTQLYEGYTVAATDDELKEFIAQNPTAVEGFTLDGSATPPASTPTTGEGTSEGAAEAAAPAAGESAAAPAGDSTPAAEGDSATPNAETPPAEEPATPSYTAADVNLSKIDAATLEQFKELWTQSNKSTKFQEWTEELVEKADIVINEMPEDVPYNVDMSLATTTEQPSSDTQTPPASAGTSTAEAVAAAIAEGLVITDEVVGTGAEATDGSHVYMLYTGKLTDGTVFDSTSTRNNEPFDLWLGSGSVIKGWDAGIVGMKVGGKRHLSIPAPLAYGENSTGSIPPNATLEFDVELVDIATQ